MKIVKRGIAVLLLIATFTCQTLPEWGLTVYAAGMNAETTQGGEAEASSEESTGETGGETGESVEGETSGSDESTEVISGEEAVPETGEASEQNSAGDSGNSGNDDAQSGSKTPELDALMETRRRPGSGSGGGDGGGSTTSRGPSDTLKATAPKKEIATDSQHESAGQIILNKTGEQILKDIWGAVQEGYESDALKTMYQSQDTLKEAQKTLFGSGKVSRMKADQLSPQRNKLVGEAQELATESKLYSGMATGMKVVSVVADGYTVVNNLKEMQNLKHERESMRTVEMGLLFADTTLATASIIATVAGVAIPGGFVAVSVAVGIASAVVHSDGFAEMMNNMDSEFLDAVDNFFENLLPWMKTPDGVNCYKPNIYFYTDTQKKVSVRFRYPGLLTATIPDYETGWEVLLTEDDRLITADGEEYTFLFYESITSKSLFQTEEGYEIPADIRAEEFERILTAMGFNAMEIADFTAFWCEKLDEGVDYLMYPQGTEIVDLAMPIIVDPLPESAERIWFVFCPDEGQEITEPETYVIERDSDYALVEWGGMIFR